LTPQRPALVAAALTLVAGIADAVGYITMDGVFAANMTGNTVLAGIGVAQHDYTRTWHHIAPLFCFFAGAMFSRLLLRLAHRSAPSLLIEAALLALVDFLPIAVESKVMIVAVAMGIQASAVTHFAGSAISTVVVTSTLARAAEYSVDRVWPGEKRPTVPDVANARLLALTWGGYLAGAMLGAFLVPLFAWPLLLPAAILVVLLVV
jgi:uncharacterized membrane protein YoaK (UPF0700 family)